MKIAIVSSWFSEDMGYIENRLPVALADLGHEVHVIASDGQVYYTSHDYQEIYERFLGPRFVPTGTTQREGFTLHRLPHVAFKDLLGIRGLTKLLSAIAPDIVQVMDHVSLSALQSAYWCTRKRAPLFTASHMHASAFKPAMSRLKIRTWLWAYLWLPGRLVSSVVKRCYTISEDASDVAHRYLGVQQNKLRIVPLGVDAKLFHPTGTPAEEERREALRSRLGFRDDEIVCIYTGRLTEQKNPLLLAQAVHSQREQGLPFRGLFVGEGPQNAAISSLEGNILLGFVSFPDLPDYYRASDIAVWPTQESTSMLDAAASGLPLVVSNRVQVRERIAEGGTVYEEGSGADLASKLKALADPGRRRELGSRGASAIRTNLTWERLAETRLNDYSTALAKRR